jgi:hypothetical protein
MPQPSINQVHIDAPLTNLSVAYVQQQGNFIADKVFPVIPVDKKSNKYYTFPKNDWLRDEAQRRAPATQSAGSGYTLSTDSYSCDKFAIHKDIDDDTVANADAALNPQREATEFVTQRMLLRKEVQFASDFLTTTVWGKDLQGVASGESAGTSFRQWSDLANSNPIDDIEYGKDLILSTTGREANTLVIGYSVWKVLKNHPDITDRYKFTTNQVITTEMVARLFELDNILVAKAVKATNNEGASGAYAYVTGKQMLLAHVAPNPGMMVPSAGYQFGWTGVSGGMGQTIGIKSFRMDEIEAQRVEATVAFDNKVVGADLGVYFYAVTA